MGKRILDYTILAALLVGVPLACCLLGAVEPLLNPVWVLIFDGERPGIFALIGGVIVVVAITVWCIFGKDKESANA
jgi:drug/metabolite transporter (DMT)-like permease